MSELVDVYRKDTGEKVRIPARWLDTRLGEPFAKTPRQKAAERGKTTTTKDNKGDNTDA